MQNNKSELPFITGLRGYAALLVFIIHAGNLVPPTRPFFTKLIAFGEYGVILFFVISAFTLCLSISKKKIFSFKKYILRRFLRIAPLYYILTIICFIFAGVISGGAYYMHMFHLQPYDPLNLITHLTFFSVFMQQYQNSLIGVEWTIPLEFSYYLLIPFLFFITRREYLGLIGLFLIGLFLYFNPTIFLPIYIYRFGGGGWALEQYLAIYVMGVMLFFFLFEKKVTKKSQNAFGKKFAVILMLFAALCYISFYITTGERVILFLATALGIYVIYGHELAIKRASHPIMKIIMENMPIFLLLLLVGSYIKFIPNFQNIFTAIFSVLALIIGSKGGIFSNLFFANKWILHIGKISYSFYLLHMIFLVLAAKYAIFSGIVRWLFVLLAVIIFSTITQRWIEEPFMTGKIFAFIYGKNKK